MFFIGSAPVVHSTGCWYPWRPALRLGRSPAVLARNPMESRGAPLDRLRVHDDRLRVAPVGIAARLGEGLGELVDNEIERDAALLEERRPRRAADLRGGDGARVRGLERDPLRFDARLAEARAREKPAQETRIVHLVAEPVLHIQIAWKQGFDHFGVDQRVA